jgi:hypothetical protein
MGNESTDIVKAVQARHKDRMQRMKDIHDIGRTPMVSVVPTQPEYRTHLKHGITGDGFPAEGPAMWPNDQFTNRRIREGSIKLEGTEEKEEDKKEDPRHGQRRVTHSPPDKT